MKVEFYNASRKVMVPTEEVAMRHLVNEFNQLAQPNRLMDLSDFRNPDFDNPEMEEEPEFLYEDFAEWVLSVWEWAIMTRGLFDESSNIQALLNLFDSLMIDTDGELDDFAGVEDWDPTNTDHNFTSQILAWKGYQS